MEFTRQALFDLRFTFVADMNADGAFTISDIWEWFKWLYFAPGDLAAIALMNTSLGNFLEISTDTLGSGSSGVISFILWAVLLFGVADALERA